MTGVVTGVRFYKGANNTGSHTGTLWTANGTLLASGTFTDESTVGLADADLRHAGDDREEHARTSRPTAPRSGRYSATPNAFAAADLSRAPLRVTSTAGAYTYGTGFPGDSVSTNYLVDVVFEKAPPTHRVDQPVDRHRVRSTCRAASTVTRRLLRPGRSPAGR